MKNFFIVIVSVLLALAGIEGFLRFHPDWIRSGQKYYFNSRDGKYYANCYPTPPPEGFTLALNSRKNCVYWRNKYGLSVSLVTRLVQEAPFCLEYNILRRQKGAFPGRPRQMFLVGDSFAFGEGVLKQGTLARCLAERLRDYNVRNFACSAADIAHIVQQARTVMENNTAPRIVYCMNLNDPLHSPALERKKRFVVDFQNLRLNRLGKEKSLPRWWDRLYFIRLIKQSWGIFREKRLTIAYYHQIYFGSDNAAAVDETFALMGSMQKAIDRTGGHLVVVIWPLIYKDFQGNYPFAAIHEEIQQRCSQMGIDCIDGRGAFRQYRSMKPFRVHPLDYHPNGRANRIMADYLVNREKLADYFQ